MPNPYALTSATTISSGTVNTLPVVTILKNGNYVVAWMRSATDNDVIGRVYSPDGIAQTPEFMINPASTLNQSRPSIVALDNGGFFAFYDDFLNTTFQENLIGQRFDDNGNAVGPQFVLAATTGRDVFPDATVLSNGNVVVAWTSSVGDGSGLAVYATILTEGGNTSVNPFVLNTITAGDQSQIDVSALSGGGFVATWSSFGADGNSWATQAQFYNNIGSKVGSEFTVNQFTSGEQFISETVQLDDGNVAFVWESNGQDGSGYGIYARIFDDTGNALTADILVNSSTAGDQRNLSLDRLEDGSFLVAWVDAPTQTVVAQRLAADGTKIGTEFTISTGIDVTVKSAGADGIIASWTEDDFGALVIRTLTLGYLSAEFTSGDDNVTVYGGGSSHNAGDGNDVVNGADTDIGGDTLLGGTGADRLFGNAGDDTLNGQEGNDLIFGGAGDDVLIGLLGNDTLVGNEGADLFSGGDGFDRVTYKNATAGVIADLSGNIAGQGEAAGDTFFSIEVLEGSNFSDTLYGTSSDGDKLVGLDGNDGLVGFGGDDRLLGGAGQDLLDGGDGADRLLGEDGDDMLIGGDGEDIFRGGAGNDVMQGGNGIDTFFGDAGADSFDGGAGSDRVTYRSSSEGLTVDMNNSNNSTGDAAGDTFVSIEKLDGSNFQDVMWGTGGDENISGLNGADVINARGGADILQGGRGSDILNGGAGNDLFFGGLGGDTMTGGNGDDRFRFQDLMGNDRITDFDDAGDDILIFEASSGATSIADLTITQQGNDVRIVYAEGTILLEDTALSSVGVDDFSFI